MPIAGLPLLQRLSLWCSNETKAQRLSMQLASDCVPHCFFWYFARQVILFEEHTYRARKETLVLDFLGLSPIWL